MLDVYVTVPVPVKRFAHEGIVVIGQREMILTVAEYRGLRLCLALFVHREAVCIQLHGLFVHLMLCVRNAIKSHFTNLSTGHTVPPI